MASLMFAAALAAPAALRAQDAPPPLDLIPTDSIAWRETASGMAFALVAGSTRDEGGSYGLLARLDEGQWIAPHWHPRDKHIVVLSGVLLIGSGPSGDPEGARELAAGGATTVPAEAVHYEGARGRTVVLFYGEGPLTTTFVGGG
ncbi:MAG: cupin domain-containing protein [Gemmatimonadota bacterium]